MNYMKQVAEMLGVELGEKFKLIGGASNFHYCINEKGLIREDSRNSDEEYFASILNRLLNGEYKIEKLPWKPKDGETFWVIEHVYDSGEAVLENDAWAVNGFNYAFYVCGNCFKTEKEAREAIPWYKANVERVNRGEKWQVEK